MITRRIGIQLLSTTLASLGPVYIAAAQSTPALTESGATLQAAAASSDAGGADAVAPEGQLSEVVVTAEKRTENVENVPISIGVLDAGQLQQEHVTGLMDLSRSVPDLADTNQTNGVPGQDNFSIRGVSSESSAGGATLNQTTTGIYLDDVAMSVATGGGSGDTSLQVFDINRIEVLRGPQGTLYGAGAMGGTIRYIMNQPDTQTVEWSGKGTVSATQGGGINYSEQGVVNVPLVYSSLALRMGAEVTNNSGWIQNYDPYTQQTTPGNNSNDSYVGHVSMLYQSDDRSLRITPSIFAQRYNADGFPEALPNTPNYSDFYLPNYDTDKIFVPSVTINKDWGWADLTSASSYFWRLNNINDDVTYHLEKNVFGVGYPTYYPGQNKITQDAEELRLTSATQVQSGLPFDWIVGAYWSDNNMSVAKYMYPQNYQTFSQLLVNTYGQAGADSYGEFPYGSNFYTQIEWLHTQQTSGFGEFNYSPISKLTATAGLRYLIANQVAYNYSSGFYQGPVLGIYTAGVTEHHLSPKYALKYAYSANGQVYANAVEGFRLGGANQPTPTSPTTAVGRGCVEDLQAIGRTSSPETYQPDSLWSYELGDKTTFFQNRFAVDAAIYHIKWNNVQQPLYLISPSAACDFGFVTNAGQAKSDGVDLSINTQIARGLTLNGTGNITHASIVSPAPDTGEVAGTWLNEVPRYQASAGFTWSHALAGGSFFINSSGQWIGDSHDGFKATAAGYLVPSYHTFQTNIGFDFGGWEVSVFGTNLANYQGVIHPGTSSPYFGTYLQPRTIGLSVEKKL